MTLEQKQLDGGEALELLYTVQTTGPNSGALTLTAVIRGQDVNDITRDPLQATGQKQLLVATTSRVRIAKTVISPEVNRVDDQGIVHVNTRQSFRVVVEVKNDGGQNLRDVRVGMLPSISSFINGNERLIRSLPIGETSTVYFDMKADSVQNLVGETLSSFIKEAIGQDGSQARVLPAMDSLAMAKIYNPAQLLILNTRNLTASTAQKVSFNQPFAVEVVVKNLGSEPVENVSLLLTPDVVDGVTINKSTLAIPGIIAGDDTGKVVFSLTALPRVGRVNLTAGIVGSKGLNEGHAAAVQTAGQVNSTFADIETNARLEILRVFTSVEDINAGDNTSNWRINVEVLNAGQSALALTEVNSSNIIIRTDGIVDGNYKITPVSLVRAGGFTLPGGSSSDTLYYVVTKNGDLAGQAEITVRLQGYDVNLGTPTPQNIQTAVGKDTISVNSVSWVRIDQTLARTRINDGRGNWLVNRGQSFDALVVVETSELGGVDSVKVELRSNGASLIVPSDVYVIPRINRASKDTARFTVTADASWSQKLSEKSELLSARIVSAKALGSLLNAQVRSPRRDSDAQLSLRIQNPARLQVDLSLQAAKDSILTVNQEFYVKVKVLNLGSAPVDTGQLQLRIPANFTLLAAAGVTGNTRSFYLNETEPIAVDSFRVRAPESESLRDLLIAEITRIPHDLNSGAATPLVAAGKDTVKVSTLFSELRLSNTRIVSPNGALDGELSTAQDVVFETYISGTRNLQSIKVALEVPVGMTYEYLTSKEVTVTTSPATVQWNLRTPALPQLGHKIFVRAQGQSVLGSQTYVDSIAIKGLVRRASVHLDYLKMILPNGTTQTGSAVFVKNKEATLTTRVLNYGTAAVQSGYLKLRVLQSGFTIVNGDSIQAFTIDKDVEWKVRAPNYVSSERAIRAEIVTIPVDVNTGKPADVSNKQSDIFVSVVEQGSITINSLAISSPAGARSDTLSTEQTFDIKASISTQRVKDNVSAKLVFSNSDYKISQPDVRVPTGLNKEIIWTVKAPADSTVGLPDSYYVIVTATDERTDDAINARSIDKKVRTRPRTTFWLEPRLSYPLGLTDQVSTGQEFNIQVFIRHQGAPYTYSSKDTFSVEINKPLGFSSREGSLLGGRTHPIWHLSAPTTKPTGFSTFLFTFRNVPLDRYSGEKAAVRNESISFTIQVVKQAEMELVATLSDTATVSYAPIRTGSIFNVRGFLRNIGEASTSGSPNMSFSLPSNYTLLKKTGKDTILWQLRAPATPSDSPDTLKVTLFRPWPTDKLSLKPVLIARDTTAFIVVKRESGLLLVKEETPKPARTYIKGALNLAMLGLSFRNKDISLNSRSVIDTLRLSFRDRKGNDIKAGDVVSRIVAQKTDDGKILAEMTSVPGRADIRLDFKSLHADTIKDSDDFRFQILVDVLDNPVVPDFGVAIDSAAAIVAKDAFSLNRLVLADSLGRRLSYLGYQSGAVVLVDQDLEKSFLNYPNPFGTSSRPETKLVYFLKKASDVKIKIFTLTGDLVYEWNYDQAAYPKQTAAGLHDGDVTWNGRNGRGHRVMSGVYLAYLTTDDGGMALTKIAVIR